MFNLILFVCLTGSHGCNVYKETYDTLEECNAGLVEIDQRIPPRGVYYLAHCQSVDQGVIL